MKEKWIELKRLLGLPDMPDTIQGITYRAKAEGWKRRRISGVKGKVFEYYTGDMPENVQRALAYAQCDTGTVKEASAEYKTGRNLKTVDEIMAAVHSLAEKVRELESPSPDSLPDTLDNDEKRLIHWFRQCNKDRRAMLLSSAEVLADMTLNE